MLAPRFQDLLDNVDVEAWRARAWQAAPDAIDAAIHGTGDALERFVALVSPRATAAQLEAMATASHALTVQRFGRVQQMYAPLYVSNECIDTCTYCGFSRGNDLHRVTLDTDQVAKEAQVLLDEGFRHVLLVSGEHPRIVSAGYLTSVVRRLRESFASVAVEVAPQYEDGYAELAAAGVDGVVVYQETYHRETYASVHLAGRKKNFDWRLETPERAGRAGMKRIGIGSLLGLADPWFDGIATFLHARWLSASAWRSQITVGVPRIKPAIGAIQALHDVPDRFLLQYICALRLCLPDLGLVLSTREPAPLRDGLVRVGITQLSAGSRTEPGGYAHRDPEAEQFEVGDGRTSAEMAERLREMGYAPVWKDWEGVLHGRA